MMDRILWNHIITWIAEGRVIDTKSEFFIRETHTMDQCPFQLSLNAIPLSHITASIAEKIFTIGKATRVLKHCKRFTQDEAVSFIQELMQLKCQEVFDSSKVERTMESIRKTVDKQLWLVVVQENRLVMHLQRMRDFFLLGKGDFYQSLIALIMLSEI